MVSERHLRILAARCFGRRNDYALQQDNGRYLRVGSSVTLEVLQRHVAGLETIGALSAIPVITRSSMPIVWMAWCSCSVSSVAWRPMELTRR